MTETEICNLALSQIGAARLSDWETDATTGGVQCRLWFKLIRNEMLEDFDWAFARKHIALSAIAAESFNNWDYVYALPGDCLKARRIENTADNSKTIFEIRSRSATNGTCLVTDQSEAVLIYTANDTSTQTWSSGFLRALALKLAAAIAYPLRNDLQLQQQVEVMAAFALNKAQVTDIREGVVPVDDTSGIIDSRN